MSRQRHLSVPARFESVPQVMDFVGEAAEQAGLDKDAIYHCQMAADEACANIIEHAYGGEGEGDIEITVGVEPGVVTITMIDTGKPFDPTSVPPPPADPDPDNMQPGGLGLFLMRKLMDEVTFTFEDGRNKLVMVKRQAAEPKE